MKKTSIATVSISGDLTEKLAAIAAAGFDGIEIFEQDFIAHDGGQGEVGQMGARPWARDHALPAVPGLRGAVRPYIRSSSGAAKRPEFRIRRGSSYSCSRGSLPSAASPASPWNKKRSEKRLNPGWGVAPPPWRGGPANALNVLRHITHYVIQIAGFRLLRSPEPGQQCVRVHWRRRNQHSRFAAPPRGTSH